MKMQCILCYSETYSWIVCTSATKDWSDSFHYYVSSGPKNPAHLLTQM